MPRARDPQDPNGLSVKKSTELLLIFSDFFARGDLFALRSGEH